MGKLLACPPAGGWDDKELPVIKQLNLLSMKPILYGLNKKAGGKNLDEMKDPKYEKILEFLKDQKYTLIDAGIENELKDLVGEEKEMFRKELGGRDNGIDNLIKKSYELLKRETY